jgi:hypothetical protein
MSSLCIAVTGVSTGIGKAISKVLVDRGFRVFGSVRKESDGESLARELGAVFSALEFDVRDEIAVAKGAATVKEALGNDKLFGLVNNAGIGVSGPIECLSIESFRTQMEVNVTGLLIVTQKFLPLLGTDRSRKGKPGRIINIGSIGGKLAPPFMGPYCASKFAVEGISESLRREVQLFGIDVIVIGPGAVATPIWDKAEQADISFFAGTEYEKAFRKFGTYFIREGRKGYPPEKIGETVLKALTREKPKVRYSVVPHAFTHSFVARLLPKRLVDRSFVKNLGLLYKG